MSKITIEPIALLSRPTISLQVDINFNELVNSDSDGYSNKSEFIRMPWLVDDAIQQSILTQGYGDF